MEQVKTSSDTRTILFILRILRVEEMQAANMAAFNVLKQLNEQNDLPKEQYNLLKEQNNLIQVKNMELEKCIEI